MLFVFLRLRPALCEFHYTRHITSLTSPLHRYSPPVEPILTASAVALSSRVCMQVASRCLFLHQQSTQTTVSDGMIRIVSRPATHHLVGTLHQTLV